MESEENYFQSGVWKVGRTRSHVTIHKCQNFLYRSTVERPNLVLPINQRNQSLGVIYAGLQVSHLKA